MINWQPIETAPKDGTIILVWKAWEGGPFGTVDVTSYNEDRGLRDAWGLGIGIEPSFWAPFSMPTTPPVSDIAYWHQRAEEALNECRAAIRRNPQNFAADVVNALNRHNMLRSLAAKNDTTC